MFKLSNLFDFFVSLPDNLKKEKMDIEEFSNIVFDAIVEKFEQDYTVIKEDNETFILKNKQEPFPIVYTFKLIKNLWGNHYTLKLYNGNRTETPLLFKHINSVDKFDLNDLFVKKYYAYG